MKSLLDLIADRRSVRSYSAAPISRELLDRSIEAARLSPSAHNQQPWKFIIVDDIDIKNRMAAVCTSSVIPFNKFVPQAPVLVAVVSEKTGIASHMGSLLKRRPFHLIDLGIAAENFCLQAQEDGLGTCMIGWFNERKIKKILHVPFMRRVHLLIAVGYTDDKKMRSKKRKNIDAMRSYNRYERF